VKNIHKKLISFILISLVLVSGFTLPQKASAESATETITKELGALAGAYMAVPAVCRGYAEATDITSGLIDQGKQWVSGFVGDKLKNAWGKVTSFFGGGEEGEGGGALEASSVPVSDQQTQQEIKNVQNQEKATRINNKVTGCKNFLRDVVLESYKKRLLDKLVNEIVLWIQGETKGKPRFVSDPGSMFQEARNEAIGDVILETQYSDLCYDDMDVKLKLQLTREQFSEEVRCTLDNVVDNITAFKDNFQDGGWIAYQESLKPNNNPSGISFLTQQELIKRTGNKEDIANYEATVGSGFLSTKRCLRWEEKPGVMVDPIPTGCTLNSQGMAYCDASVSGSIGGDGNFMYRDKTPDTDQTYKGRSASPGGTKFRCVESETVTPGQIAADSISKAIGSEIDFIINSNDLSTYGAAILNAAISRVAKMGSEGLAYVSQSEENRSCDDFDDPYLKDLCERNQGSPTNKDNPDYDLDNMWSDASTTLTIAKDSLKSASTTNTNILHTLEQTKQCQTNNNISTDETEEKIAAAEDREDKIDSKLNTEAVDFDIKLEAIKEEIEEGNNKEEVRESLNDTQSELEIFLETAASIENKLKNKTQPEVEDGLQSCLSQGV